jgi:hypothetical protein
MYVYERIDHEKYLRLWYWMDDCMIYYGLITYNDRDTLYRKAPELMEDDKIHFPPWSRPEFDHPDFVYHRWWSPPIEQPDEDEEDDPLWERYRYGSAPI